MAESLPVAQDSVVISLKKHWHGFQTRWHKLSHPLPSATYCSDVRSSDGFALIFSNFLISTTMLLFWQCSQAYEFKTARRTTLKSLCRQLAIQVSKSVLAKWKLMKRNKTWSAGQKKLYQTQPNFPGVFKPSRGRRKEKKGKKNQKTH